jgi:hypothetical protein
MDSEFLARSDIKLEDGMKIDCSNLMHGEEIGDEHNRLRILTASFVVYQNGRRRRHCFCQCKCGKVIRVSREHLIAGHTKSCGCYKAEKSSDRMWESVKDSATSHGYLVGDHPLKETYKTWTRMLHRCGYEGTVGKDLYLNVEVCKRWRIGEGGLSGFECFVEDMGPKPSSEHSLDRERGDGHYEKNNCRWILKGENSANIRSFGYLGYL